MGSRPRLQGAYMNKHGVTCDCLACVKYFHTDVNKKYLHEHGISTAFTPDNVGKKFDNGKAEWNLLYYPFLESVIRVMKLGKDRYGYENWKKPFDKSRLRNALMRHVVADMKGEYIDRDSGEPHISHVVCNAMFIYFHELKDECDDLGEKYMKSLYEALPEITKWSDIQPMTDKAYIEELIKTSPPRIKPYYLNHKYDSKKQMYVKRKRGKDKKPRKRNSSIRNLKQWRDCQESSYCIRMNGHIGYCQS